MFREPQPISMELGTDESWTVALQAADGLTLTPYDQADALECVVGRGQGLAPLFAPAATWISPAACTIRLLIARDDVADADPGVYPVDLFTTRVSDGLKRPGWLGYLELLASASSTSGTPSKVYCTAQEIIDVAGWLGSVRQSRTQANFLKARARARQWIDRAILAHVPTSAGRADLLYGMNLSGPVEAYSATIRGYLDADQLLRTDALVELAVAKSLAIVCMDQIGTDDPDPWTPRAVMWHREANRLARGFVAEIDVNADGQADYAFGLGSFALRRD